MSDLGLTLLIGLAAFFLWLVAFVARANAQTHGESQLIKFRTEVLRQWGTKLMAEIEESQRVHRVIARIILAFALIVTGIFIARVLVHVIEGAQ